MQALVLRRLQIAHNEEAVVAVAVAVAAAAVVAMRHGSDQPTELVVCVVQQFDRQCRHRHHCGDCRVDLVGQCMPRTTNSCLCVAKQCQTAHWYRLLLMWYVDRTSV
jgi:hypothetical protein